MTPKEKAMELMDQFVERCSWIDRPNYAQIRLCVIESVRSILKEYAEIYCRTDEFFTERVLFWEEVKDEVEKINIF